MVMNDICHEWTRFRRAGAGVKPPAVHFQVAEEQILLWEASAQEYLRNRASCRDNTQRLLHHTFQIFVNFFVFQLHRHHLTTTSDDVLHGQGHITAQHASMDGRRGSPSQGYLTTVLDDGTQEPRPQRSRSMQTQTHHFNSTQTQPSTPTPTQTQPSSSTTSSSTADHTAICMDRCETVLRLFLSLRRSHYQASRVWTLMHICLSCSFFLGSTLKTAKVKLKLKAKDGGDSDRQDRGRQDQQDRNRIEARYSLLRDLVEHFEQTMPYTVHPHHGDIMKTLKEVIGMTQSNSRFSSKSDSN